MCAPHFPNAPARKRADILLKFNRQYAPIALYLAIRVGRLAHATSSLFRSYWLSTMRTPFTSAAARAVSSDTTSPLSS